MSAPKYKTVDVFGDVCIAWKDVFKGQVDDLTKCIDWDKVIDKYVNGACTQDEDAGRHEEAVCSWSMSSTRRPRPVIAKCNQCEDVQDRDE